MWSCSCCGKEAGPSKGTEVANQKRSNSFSALLNTSLSFVLWILFFFLPSNYFYRSTSLFIYLFPPSVSLVQFPLQFFLLILSSMEEVCHDKDQKLKGRGGERGKKTKDAEKPCKRKIIRKENEKKAGLWSGWTTKITPETPDFIDFSLELHAFWWSLWKWDPDPNERRTGNERRWSRGRI